MVEIKLSQEEILILKTGLGIAIQLMYESENSKIVEKILNQLMDDHPTKDLITIKNINKLNQKLILY